MCIRDSFDPAQNHCRLTGNCRLKGVLNQALQSYLQVLDRVTLADLVPNTGSGVPLA